MGSTIYRGELEARMRALQAEGPAGAFQEAVVALGRAFLHDGRVHFETNAIYQVAQSLLAARLLADRGDAPAFAHGLGLLCVACGVPGALTMLRGGRLALPRGEE